MKYITRRVLFGLATLPVVLGAYAVLYFGIGLLASAPTANAGDFASNAWTVAIAWVLVVAFAKQVLDFAKQVSA